MSCCSTKESKPKAEASCCKSNAEAESAKAVEEAKSGCGCAGRKEPAPKKEEQKKASCC